MRLRSHKYPNENDDNYVDTTYYDSEKESLDVGYQLLKIFNILNYPKLKNIQRLFIDHNKLKNLPDPEYLPNLTELNCSANQLQEIPFYPNLVFLNISHNQIKNCIKYQNARLTYFDCSYNLDFNLDFFLPYCEHLYITNNEIKYINLDMVPNLKFLDAENNNLATITGGQKLVEINIKNNKIGVLPVWQFLTRLNADNNNIQILESYPELRGVNISYNKLTTIRAQPRLRKLIATNNLITDIGDMPNLTLADLNDNYLTKFKVTDNIEYLSIQFNPIKKLDIGERALKNIKELQMGFTTYKYFYNKYYNNFDHISIQPNSIKLENSLKRLNKVFDEDIIDYICRKFHKTKFPDRADAILKISLRLYWKYFASKECSIQEIFDSKEFKYLSTNITKLYYKTIVITMYFNGYLLLENDSQKNNLH